VEAVTVVEAVPRNDFVLLAFLFFSIVSRIEYKIEVKNDACECWCEGVNDCLRGSVRAPSKGRKDGRGREMIRGFSFQNKARGS
jgi:hypothetical protein